MPLMKAVCEGVRPVFPAPEALSPASMLSRLRLKDRFLRLSELEMVTGTGTAPENLSMRGFSYLRLRAVFIFSS